MNRQILYFLFGTLSSFCLCAQEPEQSETTPAQPEKVEALPALPEQLENPAEVKAPEVQQVETLPAQPTQPQEKPVAVPPLPVAPAPVAYETPVRIAKRSKNKLIPFDFNNEDISTIINKLATLQHINVIMPTGAQAINQKVTFKLDKKITIEQAERYLDTFLEMAGYTRVPHGDFFMIVKNDPKVVRETLPLYVNVPPAELPDTGRIRVIYYLQNIKVPENPVGIEPIHTILNEMLSTSQSDANRLYNFDTKANAIIIADKASNIKATMSMILELDSMGIRDTIRRLRLFNTNATTIANLLQTQIIAVSGDARGRIKADVKSESGLYFSPGTKIVADTRTNSLLLLGKEPAVERIVEFVQEYIDVPLESGNSILHYYPLQYLDATEFSEVLKKIVTAQGLSGQATVEQQSGPHRFFDGVIVLAERQVEEKITEAKLAELSKQTGSKYEAALKGTVFRGGNRLVVAARSRDWQRIEKLIFDLDKPQLQVIIQIMIIDFAISQRKILGAQTRNPSLFNLPKGVNFQTTHLFTPPVFFGNTPPPTTLATDLLTLLSGATPPNTSIATTLSSGDFEGSTILSFNDSAGTGIWSVIEWLNNFGEVKILSHPYLVTLNNRKASEVISEIRRLIGDAKTGEGGVISARQEDVEAALRLAVVPRASSRDRVNLQISITINNFVAPFSTTNNGNNNKTIRELHTNVNLGSGQMIVLGGLSQTQDTNTDRETPLLGRIPIIRWLFGVTDKATAKTNLSVFIIPTIVEPKIHAGVDRFTRDKINDASKTIDDGNLFEQLRDPVNYLFFKDQEEDDSEQMLDEYLAEASGDFVRRDLYKPKRGPADDQQPSCGKLRPRRSKKYRVGAEPACESTEEKPAPETIGESQELKAMLAGERNPILTVTQT